MSVVQISQRSDALAKPLVIRTDERFGTSSNIAGRVLVLTA